MRFRLRSVLIGITFLSILLAFWAERYRSQQYVLLHVARLRGIARVRSHSPLHLLIARSCVTEILLSGDEVSDDIGLLLRKSPELKGLSLVGTNISDRTVMEIASLSELEWLDLSATQITDAGLYHLKELPKLEHLSLSGTSITDAGLHHIKEFRSLRSLDLYDIVLGDGRSRRTAVTEIGVRKLKSELPHLFVGGWTKRPPAQ